MSLWLTPHPNPPPQGQRGYFRHYVHSPSPLEGKGREEGR
jgi:hypothetical protein